MIRPRSIFMKIRPGNMPFFAVLTPLMGCGFALAFGWLWFPVLRNILLPGLFAGQPVFHSFAFGSAMSAGYFLYSPLYSHLENGTVRQRLLNVALAHGFPMLLLCLLLLLRNNGISFAVLDAMLAGFAWALPGVWWAACLLASGPGKAVAAMAWAAFAALALSLPLSRQRPDSTDTVCILAAGLVLACLAALFLVNWERENSQEKNVRSVTAMPLETPYRVGFFRWRYVPLLFGLVSIFFSLGSLSVLVHETGGAIQAIARICALTAAVFFLDGPLERVFGIAACTLAILALCLAFSPKLAPMLFPVGAGLLEAAGIALCAVALHRGAFERSAAVSMAGLFLITTLVAANGGYLAGRELTSFFGETWPALPGLAAALLLAAAAYQGHNLVKGTGHARSGTARSRTEQEPPLPSVAPDKVCPTAATINSSIAAQLTEREQFLAVLLVNGYSNKAAAERLGLKDNTLRWHIKNLNKKTGAADRKELIAILGRTNAARE